MICRRVIVISLAEKGGGQADFGLKTVDPVKKIMTGSTDLLQNEK